MAGCGYPNGGRKHRSPGTRSQAVQVGSEVATGPNRTRRPPAVMRFRPYLLDSVAIMLEIQRSRTVLHFGSLNLARTHGGIGHIAPS